jgi:Protein of unknown function, DUF488
MTKHTPETPALVLTVGHSTRTLEAFVSLMQTHGVTRVVDIRTMPRSRHNPQFNGNTMPESLSAFGIGYTYMPGLGGLRRARPDSPNQGWRNASFRGYADYMQTPEFEENLQKLLDVAGRERIALMCAEAVPWRCHRSLIADALSVRGIPVEHIMSAKNRQAHRLTPFARVNGASLTYPPEDPVPQEPVMQTEPDSAKPAVIGRASHLSSEVGGGLCLGPSSRSSMPWSLDRPSAISQPA